MVSNVAYVEEISALKSVYPFSEFICNFEEQIINRKRLWQLYKSTSKDEFQKVRESFFKPTPKAYIELQCKQDFLIEMQSFLPLC